MIVLGEVLESNAQVPGAARATVQRKLGDTARSAALQQAEWDGSLPDQTARPSQV